MRRIPLLHIMCKAVLLMKKIIEVKSCRDIKRFINFPLELYKDSPYYVPMLYGDEKKIFKKNYVYNNTCKTIFFLCVDENDKVLGRIEGIIQIAANKKWKQNRVRFTRFDAINDQEVANLLFEAVRNWALPQGINEMVGPLGYSDLEREGLLIEGFDKIQTYEEQYNYEYYKHLIDNYGFKKDVDWIEYKITPPSQIDPRLIKASEMVKSRYGLSVYQPKTVCGFIKEYKEQFFEIIDTTYSKIYGTVPFTKEMMNASISSFILILRPQDIAVVLDKDKKVVGFVLVFPSISEIVTKYKGKIGLRFLIDFFKNKKHPKIIDLGLIGVLEQNSSQGVATLLITEMQKGIIGKNIEHLETNLMLENNHKILGLMSNFDTEVTKKRRCYVKNID